MEAQSSSSSNLFSFQVDDVKVCEILPELNTAKAVLKDNPLLDSKLEDFSHRNDKEEHYIDGQLPGFISALHMAYGDHYRLHLSVSDFILLIGQGLSKHINENSKNLRKYFVNHEGKELIVIDRNEFVKGQQNDWSTVFGEFAGEIKKRAKTDVYGVVVDDTSVATPTSRIASEITLMDCMKNFFAYEVRTKCGIPEITLEGSTEDWEKLRGKVKQLVEMNRGDCLQLDWWLKKLVPVVDKICDTAIKKEVDKEFWSGIYKYKSQGSGSASISGWILMFFPYVASGANNEFNVVETSKIPNQICKVPFIWNYYGTKIEMNFYGGFFEAKFNKESFTVQPTHFWSVAYK